MHIVKFGWKGHLTAKSVVYDFTGKSSEYTYGNTYQPEKITFLCKECGPVFPQSGNLKRHMQTHNGEGPLNCSCVTCFGTTNSNKIMTLELGFFLGVKRIGRRLLYGSGFHAAQRSSAWSLALQLEPACRTLQTVLVKGQSTLVLRTTVILQTCPGTISL